MFKGERGNPQIVLRDERTRLGQGVFYFGIGAGGALGGVEARRGASKFSEAGEFALGLTGPASSVKQFAPNDQRKVEEFSGEKMGLQADGYTDIATEMPDHNAGVQDQVTSHEDQPFRNPPRWPAR